MEELKAKLLELDPDSGMDAYDRLRNVYLVFSLVVRWYFCLTFT